MNIKIIMSENNPTETLEDKNKEDLAELKKERDKLEQKINAKISKEKPLLDHFSKVRPGPGSSLVTFKNWIISPIFLLFIIFILWVIAGSVYLNTLNTHFDDDEPYMSDLYLGIFLTTIVLIVLYLIFNLDKFSLLFIFFSLFILILNYILTYFWTEHFKGHKDRIKGMYSGILILSILGILTYVYVFFIMKTEEKEKIS